MHYSFSQEFSTDSKIVFCFLSNMNAMTLIVGCFNVASNDFDKLSVSKFSRTIAIIMCASDVQTSRHMIKLNTEN